MTASDALPTLCQNRPTRPFSVKTVRTMSTTSIQPVIEKVRPLRDAHLSYVLSQCEAHPPPSPCFRSVNEMVFLIKEIESLHAGSSIHWDCFPTRLRARTRASLGTVCKLLKIIIGGTDSPEALMVIMADISWKGGSPLVMVCMFSCSVTAL